MLGSIGRGISLPGGKTELKLDGSGTDVKESGIEIKPTPGFVIKTKTKLHQPTPSEPGCPTKLFINVCVHERIDEPGAKKKLDENGEEVEGINVPLSVGPIRISLDKGGHPSYVVDCVLNPSILSEMEKDKTGCQRDFLCQLLIESVEQKFKEYGPFDRKYKLPRMKYQGFVDPSTGQSVDQGSQKGEIATQLIKDSSKRPIIKEVESSKKMDNLPPNFDQNLPPPELDEGNDQHPKLPIKIYLEHTDKKESSISNFIDKVNKSSANPNSAKIAPPTCKIEMYTSEDNKDNLFREQLLLQPLLINPINKENVLNEISKVCAKCCIPSKSVETIEVDLSAFVLSITTKGFSTTNCVLPFCVDPQTAQCTFDNETSEFLMSVSLTNTKMEECIDVGSHPWTFAKAIKTSKKHNEKTIKAHPMGDSNKLQHKKKDGSINRDKKSLPSKCEDEKGVGGLSSSFQYVLPEDKFHANDAMSQHIIDQQEKERLDRKNSYKDKINSFGRDKNTEYLDVDDFKPGGKYYKPYSTDEELSSKADRKLPRTNKSSTLNEAEGVVKASHSALLTSSMWANLLE